MYGVLIDGDIDLVFHVFLNELLVQASIILEVSL